ncbi:MAG TPA: orotate phosphoribosyltransferase, partial [bacterium]|nr:orotate phosphoribosyltransferase [bacterium]
MIQASLLRGEFVLSSGRKSPHYIDKYRFETRPDLLRDIARLLAHLLPGGTTRLAGPALGGIPLAAAVALETGLPF